MGYTDGLKPLLGKLIEVYQGDTHDSLLKADKDIERKSIVRGILVEINGDCIVLECSFNSTTARVYINGWSISTVLEPQPGVGMHSLYRDAEQRKNSI